MIPPRIKTSAFFQDQPATDLFVLEHRQAKLGSYVANLAAMDGLINFGSVAAAVDAACPRRDRSKGGRPPYPTEVMVRMVFLQSLYNLSEEGCEHQVLDRLSVQRFCRLDGQLHIPDACTLKSFKQRLTKGGLGGRAIFEARSQQLQQQRYIPRGGQIVDASIVQAPITQTRSEERQALNEGKAPEGRSTKRLPHTDRDARWTKKYGKSFHGYKVHSNVDARWKLIRRIAITPANVDYSQTLQAVMDTANTRGRLLADRGYEAQANRDLLAKHQLRDGIARRAKPGQEARQRLDARNRAINKTRARVEHVFAGPKQLGGKVVGARTLTRNELAITLKCVACNTKRLVWLVAQGAQT
ncbi:IS5 family transposase [Aquabacterium parvum]|uniref:IS5 family transposase n=1 Tax=Aquabacterium parvum TaxID=70584 RepID=UPI00071901AA|nr:IS5 family transposase [Aquabacterium parvum]